MALGLLIASNQANADLDGALVVGELSLDGAPLESVRLPKSGYRRVAIYRQRAETQRRVRHTNGILPMVSVARQRGLKRIYVPAHDAAEAALVDGLEVYPVPNLGAMIDPRSV